jgi:sugar lactone lactonase YvrE
MGFKRSLIRLYSWIASAIIFSGLLLFLGFHQSTLAIATTTCGATIFASSEQIPLLQYPEGIAAWNGKVYISTYNFNQPKDARIFIFNASNGKLIRALGGRSGQELISSGALLGLTIDRQTGTLYAASNTTGKVLQIQNPDSSAPRVKVYAQLPQGAGPEAMIMNRQGVLFVTDSNRGVVYTIPPGGKKFEVAIGSTDKGAQIDDRGLLQSPVAGLSPNGIAISSDRRTLYINNSYTDSILAFDMNEKGQVKGNGRVFAKYFNPDLEVAPINGLEGMMLADTRIGASATTPINGPDGVAVDNQGRVWAVSLFGDNVTVFNPKNGKIVASYGNSALNQGGILNAPSNITFVDNAAYITNLGLFTDGTKGNPKLPFTIVKLSLGVKF